MINLNCVGIDGSLQKPVLMAISFVIMNKYGLKVS